MQLVYTVPLEEGSETRAVFLDISKAFDRVWDWSLTPKVRSIGALELRAIC